MNKDPFTINLLLDMYETLLTDKQQLIMQLHYREDLSLAEIAEQEGITRQGVRDNIKRAEAQLIEMEEKLHSAARFKRMMETFEEIDQALAEMEKEYSSLRRLSGVKKVQNIRKKLSSFADDYFA